MSGIQDNSQNLIQQINDALILLQQQNIIPRDNNYQPSTPNNILKSSYKTRPCNDAESVLDNTRTEQYNNSKIHKIIIWILNEIL